MQSDRARSGRERLRISLRKLFMSRQRGQQDSPLHCGLLVGPMAYQLINGQIRVGLTRGILREIAPLKVERHVNQTNEHRHLD